jgi:hypothetical protein
LKAFRQCKFTGVASGYNLTLSPPPASRYNPAQEKRRGRPKLSAKRDAPLQIRALRSEREAFYAAAELAGLTFSAWARGRLRAAAREDLRAAGKAIPFDLK